MRFERKTFFDGVREIPNLQKLNDSQVQNLTKLLDSFESNVHWSDLRHIAYALATICVETSWTFAPISERGGDHYFETRYGVGSRLAKQLGNFHVGDGAKFHGRGFVQLTGRHNYKRASDELLIDFIEKPELVKAFANAFKIMTLGMFEGWFTGHKLADYINKNCADYYNARTIINGHDRANEIADYAKNFEEALRDAETASKPQNTPKEADAGNSDASSTKESDGQNPSDSTTGGDLDVKNQTPPLPPPTRDVDMTAGKANQNKDSTNNLVTLTKERPSSFVKVWTNITAGVGAVGALGISTNEIASKAITNLSIHTIGLIALFVGLIALALWFYDRSAERANVLNQAKIGAAANTESNNVELDSTRQS